MDVRTLFVAVSVACATEVLTVGIVWLANRKVPGVGLWMLGTILITLAMSLFLFQGLEENRLVTHVVPNLLYQAGLPCLYVGACRFTERRFRPGWLVVGSVVSMLAVFWFLFGADDLAWRVRIASGWAAWMFGSTAAVFWRDGRKGLLLSTRLVAVGFSVAAAIMAFRALMWTESPMENWISGSTWQSALMGFSALVMSYLWIFCVLFVVNQYQTREVGLRIEAQHAVEQQLLEARHEIERERAMRLRQMMAREIHDGIGGITATMAMLAGLGRVEAEGDRAEILAKIEQMALEGSREIRGLMGSVENNVFRWTDWLRDLEAYSRKVTEMAGISLEWQTEGLVPREIIDDQPAAASLMKVVFESVHNLVRHSGARSGRIRVRFDLDALGIFIRDDGRGFSGERDGGRGIGNMRERIREMGGIFSIQGGEGTVIGMEVPLPLGTREVA